LIVHAKPPPRDRTDETMVYAGRRFAGAVRRRPEGFEARNADGRKIGVFGSLREASTALLEAAP
jgi:hypothetical protein